ncbi:TolC family protein [Ferruginibacter sp. HRS2-29]|uniref:TolC family protein n=1 Tax=Ferruginibacter sp. HRS2-29 TaxID=2487334 RepID=UPI0020CEC579|nr:TolC family protein [Ferruginibacter sp. HRS2-29]
MRNKRMNGPAPVEERNLRPGKIVLGVAMLICLSPFAVSAQANSQDSLLNEVTLKAAVEYAIKNQPRIQQALLDEEITASTVRSKLADWYPQVNFAYSLQHNFLLQTSVIGGNAIRLGVDNTSAGQFTASQTIFNRDVLLARRTKSDVLLQTRQTTESNKIDLAVNVTKAFYDVLATTQQIKVATENITRVERSLKDATAQYKAGITDKIDYKRATITLNNLKASKRSNEELVKAKLEYLKSLMAYPESGTLNIVYDSTAMENEIALDTLQRPDYKSRIEYRLLETQQKLLSANVSYNRWSYLPSVSVNGAYNLNFQNNDFGKLYNTNFPNSFAALTLAVPIFQGGKRKANIKTAELQLKRNSYDIAALKNNVNAQYAQALAVYQSNLENYLALKENVQVAREVYDVINLQYRSGIKTYLEVITAETDLRTSQINYFNSLYQVLAAKTDVQKALGQIAY